MRENCPVKKLNHRVKCSAQLRAYICFQLYGGWLASLWQWRRVDLSRALN